MVFVFFLFFFFFKQKTAYDMRISDWSSDVCSSDLPPVCADIVKGTDSPVLAARDEQLSLEHFNLAADETALFRQLADVADIKPAATEYRLALQLKPPR